MNELNRPFETWVSSFIPSTLNLYEALIVWVVSTDFSGEIEFENGTELYFNFW